MARPIGVILAGGSGRRMGRTKGDLALAGDERTLAERAASVLAPLCDGVLVSIARGGSNPAPGWPAVEDAPPAGQGPLAGLLAAFGAAGDGDLLVLACDYPRMETAPLARLLALRDEQDDLVIPTDGAGRDHPLVGLWRRRVAPQIALALAAGRREVRSILLASRVRRLGPADFPGFDLDALLLNANYPSDLGET